MCRCSQQLYARRIRSVGYAVSSMSPKPAKSGDTSPDRPHIKEEAEGAKPKESGAMQLNPQSQHSEQNAGQSNLNTAGDVPQPAMADIHASDEIPGGSEEAAQLPEIPEYKPQSFYSARASRGQTVAHISRHRPAHAALAFQFCWGLPGHDAPCAMRLKDMFMQGAKLSGWATSHLRPSAFWRRAKFSSSTGLVSPCGPPAVWPSCSDSTW